MRNAAGDKDNVYEAERAPDVTAPFELAPKKVALVAVDRTVLPHETGPRARTYYEHGFDPFLSSVAAAAETEGCDTVVYALWSHDLRKMAPLDEPRVFGSTTRVQTAVFEVLDGKDDRIEVWRRGTAPHRFRQRFTRSKSPQSSKQAFMEGLPGRTFGSTLIMACGETNIVSTCRHSDEIVDPFGFTGWLKKNRPRLILNPSHSYMRRHEMYSKGRTFLTVWNRGEQQAESRLPWQAFVDGKDHTDQIGEVTFSGTREIRIGVFELR
jgi:hypothetical protein